MKIAIRPSESVAETESLHSSDSSIRAASSKPALPEKIHAERFTLIGAVQGYGIRPAIARLACELLLTGSVRNEMSGVVIELEGCELATGLFASCCLESLPVLPSDVRMEREFIESRGHDRFSIIPSDSVGVLQTAVPVDMKICDRCLAELRDTNNRRFEYPFTSCTDCGPRYSILHSMPFDRNRTCMNRFSMCEECRAEYESLSDRRFHSQLSCCQKCGPQIWFSGCITSYSSSKETIALAANLIRGGKILAIKGLGGYQLMCDATNENAVNRLRLRKQRLRKPFAIMASGLEQAALLAIISPRERQAICSPAGPIVLLERRKGTVLAESIHPGLETVGVMLPTTALHALLCDICGVPLVVTSGNIEGEPLVCDQQDAEIHLSSVADGFLHHNREIVRPVDDSVVRCMKDRQVTIRAARGLTPLVVDLKTELPILAVGGQQKVSISLSNGLQSILGPHLGDLASVANRERFEQCIKETQLLYSSSPSAIVHDMHPDYFSTRWASEQEKQTVAIQHHHAHIVAGMLEHGWMDQKVIGIAFDGTGWSENGVISGGEILVASATGYENVGALRPFPLLGGEAAIREPNRIAAALLRESFENDVEEALEVCQLSSQKQLLNSEWFGQRRFSPWTTSVGRLFDGVAAIVLGDIRPSYEGELAMRLEAICARDEANAYPLDVTSMPIQIDWRPMIRALILDRKNDVSAGVMAMRFHRGLALAIASVVEKYPTYRVVLSGGVFQNRMLVELVDSLLTQLKRTVGWPGRIPPNDGGLSMGQLAIATARSRISSNTSCESVDRAQVCV